MALLPKPPFILVIEAVTLVKLKLSLRLPPIRFSISEKLTVSVGEPISSATLPASVLVICQLLF